MEFQTTNATKITALKQLLHLIVLSDGAIAPYCERIYLVLSQVLFTFDDQEFIEVVEDISSATGLAVGPEVSVPILLKLLTAEAAKSSIKYLANYMV